MGLVSKFKSISRMMKIPRRYIKEGARNMAFYYENSSSKEDAVCVESVSRELRILTHAIEKGFALPKVREGFGKEKVHRILELLELYIQMDKMQYDYEAFSGAVAMLKRYASYADEYKLDISFMDLGQFEQYEQADYSRYGLLQYDQKDLESMHDLTFEDFAKTRHSIRAYSDAPVDAELVKKAVHLAQTAPSACNRQSARIIHIRDKEVCKKIMTVQRGSMGHTPTEMLLIASDLKLYQNTLEAYLPYVDGGIFLMNLLYSLSYYGIGNCPLVWNDNGIQGEKLREIISLPKNYHVVAMVQIGAIPDGGVGCAISERRSLEDVYIEM